MVPPGSHHLKHNNTPEVVETEKKKASWAVVAYLLQDNIMDMVHID
jgi:hypothetical protein